MPRVLPAGGSGKPWHPHRRVLLVAAGMGSGHVQVAKEVARRLDQLGVETRVEDLNDLMVGPTGRWMSRLYPWMAGKAPWLYEAVYRVFFKARQSRGERVALPVLASMKGMERLCRTWQPDAIVSTYHLASQVAGRLRQTGRLAPGVHLVSFVTTFGVHDLWAHPEIDAYLCISPVAAAELGRRTSAPVLCCGPVVRPAFRGARPRPAVPIASGRPTGVRRALIVAGSLGIGKVEDLARYLAAAPGWLAVVVCGRNEDLRRRLENAGEPENTGGLEVLGWVDDMAGLMDRADVLVDNAAGLTAKEALAFGLPVVVFRPIAGHGRDDARAMARLGVTEIVERFPALVPALERASSSPEGAKRTTLGKELFCGDAAAAVVDLCGWPVTSAEPVPAAV